MKLAKFFLSRSYKKYFIVLWLGLFFIASVFSYPNIGGIGHFIPNNVLLWYAASLFIFFTFFKILIVKHLILSKYIFFLFITLFVILLLGSINSDLINIFPYALSFTIFYLFIFSVSQYKFSSSDIYLVLFIIYCLGFIEVLISWVQLFDINRFAYHLTGYSPFLKIGQTEGTFQQVNIFANFMALNLVIGLYLLLNKYQYKYSTSFVYIATAMIVFVLMVSGSRAGLLAALVGILMMSYALRNRLKSHFSDYLKWLFAVSIGLLLALIAQEYYGYLLDKLLTEKIAKVYEGTDVRWFIYKSSLDMFLHAPLFGYGLGNFSLSFQNYISGVLIPDYASSFNFELVTHPHNEILYYSLQSGVFALVAIFVFSIYTLFSFLKNKSHECWVFLSFLAPFVIQSQVSLPFLLSTLFILMFGLMLALGVRSNYTVYKFSFSTLVNSVVTLLLLSLLVLVSFQTRYSLLAIDEFYYFKNRLFLYQNADYSGYENQGYFTDASKNILYAQVVENTMNDLAERSLKNNNEYDMNKYNEWLARANLFKPQARTLLIAIKVNMYLGKNKNALKFYSQMEKLYPFSYENEQSSKYYKEIINNL